MQDQGINGRIVLKYILKTGCGLDLGCVSGSSGELLGTFAFPDGFEGVSPPKLRSHFFSSISHYCDYPASYRSGTHVFGRCLFLASPELPAIIRYYLIFPRVLYANNGIITWNCDISASFHKLTHLKFVMNFSLYSSVNNFYSWYSVVKWSKDQWDEEFRPLPSFNHTLYFSSGSVDRIFDMTVDFQTHYSERI
jgi:hypothetical protein